jgi:hypothetical protein
MLRPFMCHWKEEQEPDQSPVRGENDELSIVYVDIGGLAARLPKVE